MRGFQWRNQRNLCGEFTDRYFNTLLQIYTERDVHYAQAFGSLIFPYWDKTGSMLKRLECFRDELESSINAPSLLKKDIAEQIDHYKRTLPILTKQE